MHSHAELAIYGAGSRARAAWKAADSAECGSAGAGDRLTKSGTGGGPLR